MRSTRLLPLFLIAVYVPTFAVAAKPVRIAPLEMISRQPQAAVSDDGAIYVAFGSTNAIYCSVSTDRGKSFAPPVEVGKVDSLALGMRRGPRIAVHEKTVVITAIGGERGGGRDGDVLAWHSTDGGHRWQGPVKVSDVPASAREGLHAMAASPNGDLYCTWLDLRGGKSELFGAGSTDGGATWSENKLVYRSPSGTICECCHPAASYDAEGTLFLMWRNAIDGNRDMYVVASRDGGHEFGAAKKLGRGNWKLDACPMAGGYLAAGPTGQLTTVWRREHGIFRTTAGRPREQRLGPGTQPWIAGGRQGTYLVWLARRRGDLMLLTPQATEPVTLAHDANDPVIAAPLTGNGPVVAVWETVDHRAHVIMAAVVSD